MKELEIFHEISSNPYAYAKKWKEESGKKIVGYFCTYGPEELIWAAGALPFRIFGGVDSISLADAHLQAYSCSLVRGGLEEALAGKLDFLDGTLFPHTCDSIQRLSDIWRLNTGFAFHIDVVLPVKLDTESARDYMTDVLKNGTAELAKELGTTIGEAELNASIDLFNAIRAKLETIYELKNTSPGIISGKDLYAIIRTSMIMDRKELLSGLEALVTKLVELSGGVQANSHKRILLAGGLCNHPDIYSIIEESGGTVIWDDLCTGTRSFTGRIETGSGDPVKAIGERYIERVVCPAKHASNTGRGDNLVRLAEERNCEGVIFLFLKFCDPQAFDIPYMKEYLDNKGIPNMIMEIEEQLPSEGQLKTRFESFIQMI
ncbi:MAG: 2-hydroxyacyl-CoA dehydratase [bacterium]|nr:2-hydroxyacyl-CoA dehydratase [bacterium]